MKGLKLFAVLGIIALVFPACDTGGGKDDTSTPVSVTGVSLNQSTLYLAVDGAGQTLTATVTPANASNKAVTWSSDDTAVAAVSSSGVVTPVGLGTAEITVSTNDGSFTAACAVTVVTTLTPVTGVNLDQHFLTLADGGASATLTATVLPAGATNKAVTWSSSDEDVAAVVGGVVSPVAEGTATITVTTDDGGFEDTCAVTVDPSGSTIAPTGVTLDQSVLTLYVGGASATLTPTVLPTNASNKGVSWLSSDIGVATVIGGVVSPVSVGTATITVNTDYGGNIAHCLVTVYPPIAVTGVTLDQSTLTFTAGGPPQTLTPTVAPANATNQAVTWSTSNAAVAAVTNGVVTATGAGTATITVTTVDGSKTDTCTVTVNPSGGSVAVTGVTLDITVLAIKLEDGAQTLTATVSPGDATNKAVTWSTSDPAVAAVTGGVITPVGYGSATITVETTDGSFTADCDVVVSYIDLVWIEAGTFTMGSPPGEANRRANETQFVATLSEGFYMAQYPVKVKEFAGVGLTPAPETYVDITFDNFPIGNVSWYDAVNFCNKLSEEEGLDPVYTITSIGYYTGYYNFPGSISSATVTADFTKNGYRLPTEAQWEYACRAGTETAYWWGNTFDSSKARHGSGTNGPVGQYPANPWNLYDMSGTVGEWVWDRLGTYPTTPTIDWVDPPGSTETASAMTRGGPFDEAEWTKRSACRNDSAASGYSRGDTRYSSIGIRVIRPGN